MKIDAIYSSAGCNRTSNCIDWGSNNLICYGACNAVVICEPPSASTSSRVRATLNGHTARVNCVKWVEKAGKVIGILSGSDDKHCSLWRLDENLQAEPQLLQGHSAGVVIVDSGQIGDKMIIASASMDSTIKLWTEKGECLQTLNLRRGFCLSLRIFGLGNVALLAYSTDDDRIYLLSRQEEGDFEPLETLSGHKDWITSLDFIQTDERTILLASGSQDAFIRLWRVALSEDPKANFIDESLAKLDADFKQSGKPLSDKLFASVTLESVLQSHEGWVSSVCWHRDAKELQLLSSAVDKSVIVWSPGESGVWTERVRTGLVGGNALGFFGAKFSPSGGGILGYGYCGNFHLWLKNEEDNWSPALVVGGHFAEVQDIAWESSGAFLVSCSFDQTTRIHAPWKGGWHEIARPQIHGYDMHCMAILSRYQFASGAEEKIVRVFQAPASFVESFRQICAVEVDPEGDEVLKETSKGASRPNLGLSNKPVDDLSETQAEEFTGFVPMALNEPPSEEALMQNTLWPEMQKLYGHDGYEVFSMASRPDGRLLASACKATTAEHAQIFLWDTDTWTVAQKLTAHNLTVTQMRFSPDGKLLLTVSRDRRWTVFERGAENNEYVLKDTSDKRKETHSRIIWCCDWTHDSRVFATGSRDDRLMAWRRNEDGMVDHLATVDLKKDVTAVAFAHRLVNDAYLAAVGFGSGEIELWSLSDTWTKVAAFPRHLSHHLTVRKVAFRPGDATRLELATCAEDNFVKLFRIN